MDIERRHEDGETPNIRGLFFARFHGLVALLGGEGQRLVQRFRVPISCKGVVFRRSVVHLFAGGATPCRPLATQKHRMAVGEEKRVILHPAGRVGRGLAKNTQRTPLPSSSPCQREE